MRSSSRTFDETSESNGAAEIRCTPYSVAELVLSGSFRDMWSASGVSQISKKQNDELVVGD